MSDSPPVPARHPRGRAPRGPLRPVHRWPATSSRRIAEAATRAVSPLVNGTDVVLGIGPSLVRRARRRDPRPARIPRRCPARREGAVHARPAVVLGARRRPGRPAARDAQGAEGAGPGVHDAPRGRRVPPSPGRQQRSRPRPHRLRGRHREPRGRRGRGRPPSRTARATGSTAPVSSPCSSGCTTSMPSRRLPRGRATTHIGRRLSDNEELEDAPESAHVKRTAQESFDPEAFVLRRSMPWMTSMQAGLMFVAFGSPSTPSRRRCGGWPATTTASSTAMFRISRPVTGAYFWCPPMRSGQLDLRQPRLRLRARGKLAPLPRPDPLEPAGGLAAAAVAHAQRPVDRRGWLSRAGTCRGVHARHGADAQRRLLRERRRRSRIRQAREAHGAAAGHHRAVSVREALAARRGAGAGRVRAGAHDQRARPSPGRSPRWRSRIALSVRQALRLHAAGRAGRGLQLRHPDGLCGGADRACRCSPGCCCWATCSGCWPTTPNTRWSTATTTCASASRPRRSRSGRADVAGGDGRYAAFLAIWAAALARRIAWPIALLARVGGRGAGGLALHADPRPRRARAASRPSA